MESRIVIVICHPFTHHLCIIHTAIVYIVWDARNLYIMLPHSIIYIRISLILKIPPACKTFNSIYEYALCTISMHIAAMPSIHIAFLFQIQYVRYQLHNCIYMHILTMYAHITLGLIKCKRLECTIAASTFRMLCEMV